MDNMGRLWFSVFRTGIGIYDPKSKKLLSLFSDSSSKENLIGKSIFDMQRSPDGKIIFTNGYNVFIVNQQNFSYSKINLPTLNDAESIERVGPRYLLFDRQNRLLVLSWPCIYQLLGNQLHQLYPAKGVTGFNMQVLLKWQTAQEINNRSFEIQPSTDGVNFSAIGWINGMGNSISPQNYSFTDRTPAMSKNFYRLKQMDIDGGFKYSPIRKVDFENEIDFSIYPNPVKNILTIQFGDNNNKQVKITDMTGRTIKLIENVKQLSLTISLEQLPSGIS